MSAELVDPFAPAPIYPMTAEEYDAIRDDLRDCYLRQQWLLPAMINRCVAVLGVIAQTGTDADNRAATQALRHLIKDAMEAAG
jgi:hypothetical protein